MLEIVSERNAMLSRFSLFRQGLWEYESFGGWWQQNWQSCIVNVFWWQGIVFKDKITATDALVGWLYICAFLKGLYSELLHLNGTIRGK